MNIVMTLAQKTGILSLQCTMKLHFQASCIDSTAQPEAVFASEVKKLQADKLKPQEQITLEPYERDHAVVVGVYRPPPKSKGS
jgi:rRNA 2'-O-methyltransferase fibrillarin